MNLERVLGRMTDFSFWVAHIGQMLGTIVPGVFSLLLQKTSKAEIKRAVKLVIWILSADIFLSIICEGVIHPDKIHFSDTNAGSINASGRGYMFLAIDGISKGLFIAAVVSDIIWQEIYDFIWIIGLAINGTVLLFCGNISVEILVSLVIFWGTQEILMRRFYGTADCHAFCFCALLLAIRGRQLEYYVGVMLASWIILVIVQAAKKNIDSRGKLRAMIPMLPYIGLGFEMVCFLDNYVIF